MLQITTDNPEIALYFEMAKQFSYKYKYITMQTAAIR